MLGTNVIGNRRRLLFFCSPKVCLVCSATSGTGMGHDVFQVREGDIYGCSFCRYGKRSVNITSLPVFLISRAAGGAWVVWFCVPKERWKGQGGGKGRMESTGSQLIDRFMFASGGSSAVVCGIRRDLAMPALPGQVPERPGDDGRQDMLGTGRLAAPAVGEATGKRMRSGMTLKVPKRWPSVRVPRSLQGACEPSRVRVSFAIPASISPSNKNTRSIRSSDTGFTNGRPGGRGVGNGLGDASVRGNIKYQQFQPASRPLNSSQNIK